MESKDDPQGPSKSEESYLQIQYETMLNVWAEEGTRFWTRFSPSWRAPDLKWSSRQSSESTSVSERYRGFDPLFRPVI